MKNLKSIKSLPISVQEDIRKRGEQHEVLLHALSLQHKDITNGYFGPDSMTWKIYREPAIVLGSTRALLLQIAHPAIAKGVALFSNYEKDFAGRAHRTFLSMVRIWFGDIPTANKSAKRLHIIHSMIRGQVVGETEDETLINPFCAADPDLLYWVLATLIDTSILLYEKTIQKLSEDEKEQFYAESKITAQLMGIPLTEYPKDLADFYRRNNKIVQQGTLRLSTENQSITRALFKTPYPLRRFSQIMADGFFPEAVKKLYGFKPSSWTFNAVVGFTKIINKLTPDDLRFAPHYHQAKFRLALSNRRKPKIIERWHHWLSTRIHWYFISNALNP